MYSSVEVPAGSLDKLSFMTGYLAAIASRVFGFFSPVVIERKHDSITLLCMSLKEAYFLPDSVGSGDIPFVSEVILIPEISCPWLSVSGCASKTPSLLNFWRFCSAYFCKIGKAFSIPFSPRYKTIRSF